MKMMIDGLETMAGNRMRSIIERATSNRFLGIAVGTLVTVIIQSSTATSVIAVGFINAGLMSLSQAISLVIGAHIGTTFTAHLFAFRVTDAAPLFIFIGLILYLFLKKKSVKDFGFIFLGIGILFFGLSVMGGPLRIFAQTPGFQSMLTAFENPFLAILSGFVFTAIIQSSTAATGILVTLYLSGIDLNFTTAAFLVLGISVGTTVTALIASLAGRRESKRLAIANTIYITIGCTVFGILISIFPGILQWFQNTWSDGARQIAMFYTFFKAGLTIIFLPFISYLAQLMYKIMPKRTPTTESRELHYIKASAQAPSVIIDQTYDELTRMGRMALENLELALDAFWTSDEEKVASVLETESSINYLNRQITTLLMQLENVGSVAEMRKIGALMYIASDLERIGDHAENITEYQLRTKKKGNLRLSEKAVEELTVLGRATVSIVALTMGLFDKLAEETFQKIYDLERYIDDLSKAYIENHINRLKNEKNNPRGGVIFVNMVTNLERCADHANNIAYYFTEIKQFKTAR
jgi:phosphate:Na+ symporter